MTRGLNTARTVLHPFHRKGVFVATVLAVCTVAWISPVRAQINPFRG